MRKTLENRFVPEYHDPGVIIVDTKGELEPIATTHEGLCEHLEILEGEPDGEVVLTGS